MDDDEEDRRGITRTEDEWRGLGPPVGGSFSFFVRPFRLRPSSLQMSIKEHFNELAVLFARELPAAVPGALDGSECDLDAGFLERLLEQLALVEGDSRIEVAVQD